jgi:hypothetical protein
MLSRSGMLGLVVAALTVSTSIVGLVNLDRINRWERSAGYPLGKLCDAYRNCKGPRQLVALVAIGGEDHAFILDYGMTPDDCNAARAERRKTFGRVFCELEARQ